MLSSFNVSLFFILVSLPLLRWSSHKEHKNGRTRFTIMYICVHTGPDLFWSHLWREMISCIFCLLFVRIHFHGHPGNTWFFSECYIESTSFSYHIPDRTFIYFILQWCSCYINFFTLNSRVSQSQRRMFNVVSKGAHIANH